MAEGLADHEFRAAGFQEQALNTLNPTPLNPEPSRCFGW